LNHVETGRFSLNYLSGKRMPADGLTKGLSADLQGLFTKYWRFRPEDLAEPHPEDIYDDSVAEPDDNEGHQVSKLVLARASLSSSSSSSRPSSSSSSQDVETPKTDPSWFDEEEYLSTDWLSDKEGWDNFWEMEDEEETEEKNKEGRTVQVLREEQQEDEYEAEREEFMQYCMQRLQAQEESTRPAGSVDTQDEFQDFCRFLHKRLGEEEESEDKEERCSKKMRQAHFDEEVDKHQEDMRNFLKCLFEGEEEEVEKSDEVLSREYDEMMCESWQDYCGTPPAHVLEWLGEPPPQVKVVSVPWDELGNYVIKQAMQNAITAMTTMPVKLHQRHDFPPAPELSTSLPRLAEINCLPSYPPPFVACLCSPSQSSPSPDSSSAVHALSSEVDDEKEEERSVRASDVITFSVGAAIGSLCCRKRSQARAPKKRVKSAGSNTAITYEAGRLKEKAGLELVR
jgi:hypothetical protein